MDGRIIWDSLSHDYEIRCPKLWYYRGGGGIVMRYVMGSGEPVKLQTAGISGSLFLSYRSRRKQNAKSVSYTLYH